jgi:hypothetical protein
LVGAILIIFKINKIKILKSMNKSIAIIILIVVLVGSLAFYSGMRYAQNKISKSNVSQVNFQNLQNLSPQERQKRLQEFGMRFRNGNQRDANFAAGEIIAKDDKSVTIKLRDGGSKIIFFSGSTEITKFVAGNLEDLEVGKNIVVNGSTNPDGSVTAQLIQLRPSL